VPPVGTVPYLRVLLPEAGSYLVHATVNARATPFLDPSSTQGELQCAIVSGSAAFVEPVVWAMGPPSAVLLTPLSETIIVTVTAPEIIIYGCAQFSSVLDAPFSLFSGTMTAFKVNIPVRK
jgi:hypothetical protein